MKATLNDIRKIIGEVLSEAKKKKEVPKKKINPSAYEFDEAFDFSTPLGDYNLYGIQGAVNWGPHTSPGRRIESVPSH